METNKLLFGNNVEVAKLATDLSDLVINKVLAREMSMQEALNATSLIPTLVISKTMPKEMQEKQLDKATLLATDISISVRDSVNAGSYNVADIVMAMAIALEYIINNMQDKN